MKTELPSELLSKLSEHLAQHMGINFSTDRLSDLEKNIDELAEAFDFDKVEEFIDWLVSDPLDQEQIELLADYLTVGETYFFRDPKAFAVLENEIFPQLISQRKNSARFMRIWSAACCTGEEPYSIAILLNKLIPDLGNWQIKILATDINQTFLKRASEGVYGEWSFRATDSSIRERYFTAKKNGRYQINSAIKRMVQFEWMNLADPETIADPVYSCMDIIFCRNVFIYFSSEHAKQIISRLSNCLVTDGYLFVSPNELPVTSDCAFQSLHRPGAIILQKTNESIAPEDHLPFHHAETNSHSNQEKGEPLPTLEEAQAAYGQALYKEAAELLLKRCKAGGDFSSLTLLARSYANQGDLQNAHKWCDHAIKANRLNAETYYLRATIEQEQGLVTEAIHSLKQALLMNSNFVLAEFTLGNLLRQNGNRKDAQRHFGSALKLLNNYRDDEILPESDGTTASGLRVIVSSLMADSVR